MTLPIYPPRTLLIWTRPLGKGRHTPFYVLARYLGPSKSHSTRSQIETAYIDAFGILTRRVMKSVRNTQLCTVAEYREHHD